MSSARSSFAGRFLMLGAAAVLAAATAHAQLSTPAPSDASANPAVAGSASWSSSTDYALPATGGDEALPSSPEPASAGQYDNKSAKSGAGWKGHLALEFGGGFDMPVSDTTSYSNDGFDFNVGGGFHFSHGLGALIEYQFISNGLPSAIAQQAGVDGGNIHIWGFSVDPVIDLMPHHNTGVYVTGGAGFYRKLVNFQVQQPQQFCTYFYCGIGYAPSTVGHFSSNQAGFNAGGGISHRFAGEYGDGKMAVFAEVRYEDVLSPAINNKSANGLGATTIGADTKLLPINFGLRF